MLYNAYPSHEYSLAAVEAACSSCSAIADNAFLTSLRDAGWVTSINEALAAHNMSSVDYYAKSASDACMTLLKEYCAN
jgi:hypothetical protein